MNKIPFLLICFFLAITILKAQDLKIDFPKGTIILEGFANLSIEGHDGAEVIISENVKENFFPNQTKGLKKINARSVNESLELKYKIKGDQLRISEPSSYGSYIMKVPKNLNIYCNAEHLRSYGSNKTYSISNITGEIEIYIMDMVNIDLEKISNQTSIVTHGNITASITSFPTKGLISFDTYRGFVDLTMAKNTSTMVNLTSMEGDIYTDFEVKKKGKEVNAETFLGSIGKGENELIVHTEKSGNIYLRKMK